MQSEVMEGRLRSQLGCLAARNKTMRGPYLTDDRNVRLFVDRCYNRNHWYVIEAGRFVAGPYATKGEAIGWMMGITRNDTGPQRITKL